MENLNKTPQNPLHESSVIELANELKNRTLSTETLASFERMFGGEPIDADSLNPTDDTISDYLLLYTNGKLNEGGMKKLAKAILDLIDEEDL